MLPFIDEHSVIAEAAPEATWDAVVRVVSGVMSGRVAGLYARAIGCEESKTMGDPTRPGSHILGFHVVSAVRPSQFRLAGRHRFSRYTLDFLLEPTPAGTMVRARTHAVFPGLLGSIYRLLVIRSGIHVFVVRRMLELIRLGARRPLSAERP